MITPLLPTSGNLYKTNLHCHTNVSDGRLSPAEVKELYMAHGYSIVAYTDHEVLIPQPSYVSYAPTVTFAGGVAVPVKTILLSSNSLLPLVAVCPRLR